MKNYIKFALLSGSLILGSCSKDFLDRPLENTSPAESVDYTDLSLMYQPVSGVYRNAGKAAPGFVHWVDLGIRGVRGDDLNKGSSTLDQSPLTDIKYFRNTGISVQNFWGMNNCWTDYYGFIFYCNEALAELDKFAANIPASDAASLARNKSYKGELRFLRAFAHLTVSRVFGDVPILTDNAMINEVPKSTVDQVRQFIIDEMDLSIPDMEDVRPNQASHVGAVTKYSALLLKAKAATDLAKNDNGSTYWNIVLDATNQIISSNKFSLYADYYELFKRPGKLSNESLYEIQFTDFGTSSGTDVSPDAFFAFQGPSGNQQGSPISGWGFLTPSQKIVDFLTARGEATRLKTTILYAGATTSTFVTSPSGDNVYGNTNGDKYFNGKVYFPKNQMTPGRTSYGSDNNVRVYRYSDVLLLNAEAKIRKGQNGDQQLNMVRNRVGLGSITNATLQQVLDERRAEFACEWWGERYNDLVRTGTAATALAEFGFVAGQSEYLPIPQVQKDLNQNLN
ncbi:RagB/SusD family nutrient uptake outer membrane protein [Sphingobacterium sp. SRCM116780]|uniref:RagB/SusD family nutrient uptake outer membrane protein n=1 Tax=Sphingobacterium sp. SRCM116780 TaxID=2907623 RepID=UPI001F3F3F4D|nr:RagB/SusD family nutrient uptake outer membrane protein [Sphingobacterium sp. SRCM116780]UIR54690.1 RagB/SusD family nutrient uptake outer membrane protein [Sphingobacterium sp. SRCM116780]